MFREMHLPSSERYLERLEGKPFGLPRRRAAAELYLALLVRVALRCLRAWRRDDRPDAGRFAA